MMTFRSRSAVVVTLLLLAGCLTPTKLAGYRDQLLSRGLAVDAAPCRQVECLHQKSNCLKALAETQSMVESANIEVRKLASLWDLPRSGPLSDKVKAALAGCEGLP